MMYASGWIKLMTLLLVRSRIRYSCRRRRMSVMCNPEAGVLKMSRVVEGGDPLKQV
jgi:hypothetical protein